MSWACRRVCRRQRKSIGRSARWPAGAWRACSMPADGLNVARRVTPTGRWYGTGLGHRPPVERGPIWLGLAPARSAARPRASPDDPRPDVGDTRSHGGRRRGALRAPLEEEPRVIALPGTRTQASLHPRAVDRAALGRERRRRGAARYGSARAAREATRLGRHDTADPRRLPRRLQDPRRVRVRRLAHRGAIALAWSILGRTAAPRRGATRCR